MTNAEARCNKSLRPRKPEGSLGRTAQDVHLDSHTAPELWLCSNLTPAFIPLQAVAHDDATTKSDWQSFSSSEHITQMINTHMHTRTHAYTHTCMHEHMHAHTHIHTTHTHTHIYACTYLHTHTWGRRGGFNHHYHYHYHNHWFLNVTLLFSEHPGQGSFTHDTVRHLPVLCLFIYKYEYMPLETLAVSSLLGWGGGRWREGGSRLIFVGHHIGEAGVSKLAWVLILDYCKWPHITERELKEADRKRKS